MRIAATTTAFPPHYFRQDEVLELLKTYWDKGLENAAVLERLHSRTGVDGRYFSRPLNEYAALDTWGKTNDVWIETAVMLGEQAVGALLRESGLDPEKIGTMITVSVTGIACPSIEARLINRMHLPVHIKRTPIFGLGCVAGASGLAHAADYVRAYPDQAAILLSVELCSLTWQRNNLSVPNLISSGLFGDGAAAVLVVGDQLAEEMSPGRATALGPRIVASQATFYPDSEEVMGWAISEHGFRIILSADVPTVVKQHLGGNVDDFLAQNGLKRSDIGGQIGSWIMHTGGPKVLEANAEALGLTREDFRLSWEALRRAGNLSSASVLMVLNDVMREHRPVPGTRSLLIAMGPGFCSEMLLLEWG
uniref:Chalcone and stilbene synthases-like n=1 Tax=mine drainage metagenome TaxID=410659 RepID=E6PWQ2_9ZZZZ